MEVYVDLAGYVVILDSANQEVELLGSQVLEGEIVQIDHSRDPGLDIPTGKLFSLRVDKSLENTQASYYPRESSFEELQRVDVRVSTRDYDDLMYGRGRILLEPPSTWTDFLIR